MGSDPFRHKPQKSSLKRDGPVFFSSAPVKVAGDERTITAIVVPHREGRRVAVPNWHTSHLSVPLCLCGQPPLFKTQKLLNEPNSKNTNPPLNIDDFTNFDFVKKRKQTQFNPIPSQFLSLKPTQFLSYWWRMEFGIRCFCPFLPSCFPYYHSGLCEKSSKNPMNPQKSK